MSAPRPASPLSILAAIGELTLRRLWRGRALWVSVAIALLPVAFAAIFKSQASAHEQRELPDILFVFELLLLAVVPSMFVSSSIGEEIEDRTTTYLWSRALPRWTIVVGKLLALVPIILVLVVGNWFLAMQVGAASPPAMTYVALACGGIALSCLAAGLATLVPKHGMALTVCYVLFFDLPTGALPASIREISFTHHLRSLSDLRLMPPGLETSLPMSLLGLALLSTVWMAVALARIRRIES